MQLDLIFIFNFTAKYNEALVKQIRKKESWYAHVKSRCSMKKLTESIENIVIQRHNLQLHCSM